MTKTKFIVSGLCLALALAASAVAVAPNEILSDPALETRARSVSKELRCVVCQNQSIDDSNAPLAGDMRIIVRERIAAGDSDAEVKAYLVKRYGNFVLLKPPVQRDTLFLWAGPAIFLIIAISVFGFYLARTGGRTVAAPANLTDDEQRRLDDLRKDQSS